MSCKYCFMILCCCLSHAILWSDEKPRVINELDAYYIKIKKSTDVSTTLSLINQLIEEDHDRLKKTDLLVRIFGDDTIVGNLCDSIDNDKSDLTLALTNAAQKLGTHHANCLFVRLSQLDLYGKLESSDNWHFTKSWFDSVGFIKEDASEQLLLLLRQQVSRKTRYYRSSIHVLLQIGSVDSLNTLKAAVAGDDVLLSKTVYDAQHYRLNPHVFKYLVKLSRLKSARDIALSAITSMIYEVTQDPVRPRKLPSYGKLTFDDAQRILGHLNKMIETDKEITESQLKCLKEVVATIEKRLLEATQTSPPPSNKSDLRREGQPDGSDMRRPVIPGDAMKAGANKLDNPARVLQNYSGIRP